VFEGAGPDGQPGVIQIYPGLCTTDQWPGCSTGKVLAQAIPADYKGDPLLTNWTKPSYNPIMEDAERDPSSPWKMPSGEWRFRAAGDNGVKIYGAASDADVVAGKWYIIGVQDAFVAADCPSFFPLPGPTPGFEAQFAAAADFAVLPTHIQKGSFGGDGDKWQIGTYTTAPRKVLGECQSCTTPTPVLNPLCVRGSVVCN
jgi:hypothetical protein